jgi:hypothetical protein
MFGKAMQSQDIGMHLLPTMKGFHMTKVLKESLRKEGLTTQFVIPIPPTALCTMQVRVFIRRRFCQETLDTDRWDRDFVFTQKA